LSLGGLIAGGISEPLALALLSTAGHSIELLDQYINVLVRLPLADVPLADFQGLAVLLLLLPFAWVLLPRGWPGRRIAVLGVISIVSWKPSAPPSGCFDTWVLDVGQGLAVAVQTQNDVMLFDTGIAWRGGGSVAEQSIVPFLRSRGINRIEWLVVSHDDLDHSGGLEAVRDAVQVGTVIVGESLRAGSDEPCRAGQSWQSAGITFDVLHPQRADRTAGNASSCVLRVSAGPYGLLLTGDIEAKSEYQLLEDRARLASRVAVVPHHGSMTSSTAPFVSAVRPEYAIVSAGFANRWGFPKPRIMERWQQAGATVLTTATSGAVHFRMCAAGGVAYMREEREQSRRFWYAGT
jgi:competence protein ComEC